MNIKVFPSDNYSNKLLLLIEGKTPTFEENEKAAKFINKAPEMLEMLKHLLSLKHIKDMEGKTSYYIEEMPKAWAKAQQLIKEATEL